ncbi:MAG: hypothetical protein ACHQ0I_05140, partial [Candidatus Lutacidiplasmatales archaeon]
MPTSRISALRAMGAEPGRGGEADPTDDVVGAGAMAATDYPPAVRAGSELRSRRCWTMMHRS